MLTILAFFGIVLISALSYTWFGFALSVLWGWFMVPGLGLPPLSIGYATGVAMVVGFLTKQDNLNEKIEDWAEYYVKFVLTAALKPVIVLGIGAIVKAFL